MGPIRTLGNFELLIWHHVFERFLFILYPIFSYLTSPSSIFCLNSTLGEISPTCLSVGLTKSRRIFAVWIWLWILERFLQLPLRDWCSGTQPQTLRGSVKSLCCVCAAELGWAPGKGSAAERQPVFPKYYLELLGSTKCTIGLIGIKQVLTNHGSALISLWSCAVHYNGFQPHIWRNNSKSF